MFAILVYRYNPSCLASEFIELRSIGTIGTIDNDSLTASYFL